MQNLPLQSLPDSVLLMGVGLFDLLLALALAAIRTEARRELTSNSISGPATRSIA